MLIKHLRDAYNVPFATVVAIGRDMVGVSICCPKDRFNKKRGIEVAVGRAEKNHVVELPNRKVGQWVQETTREMGGGSNTYDYVRDAHVDDIVECEVIKMTCRSRLYYKE